MLNKKKAGKLTKTEQESLDKLISDIMDLEESMEGYAESSYTVPDNEKHLYHVLLEKGARFNQNTGEKLSTPFLQKFNAKDFANFKANMATLGYTSAEILHDPTK